MSNPDFNYHPIIGLVVLAMLMFQPLLGFVHHVQFKKTGGRQMWSYLHMFNGRIFIPLGIANGALGLWLAGESKKLKTAYIAVSILTVSLWILAACWSEWRRWKKNKIVVRPVYSQWNKTS